MTWFQPLQRVLLRRLEDESELATDALAIARTRQPLALARTLERVALWIAARPAPALGVAMARPGATVLARVERLVALRDVATPRSTRNVALGTLSALALVACAAPKMTTEARVGLTGAEAFALLTPVIDRAEQSDKPIWKLVTSDAAVRDFGEHPWRASMPLLVLHLAHDPERPERPPIHAFGQRLQDAEAAAELARLTRQRCPTLVVHVATTPEVTERSVAELQRALADVDVVASQAVIRDDAAKDLGRRLDASRLGLHDPDAAVRVAPYQGPDAEPFEQRFVLRLDERGELRGLPEGQVPFDFVADRLGSARTGPLDRTTAGPQPEVIEDRVLIECEAATPFEAVLHWFAALAGHRLAVWKTELAPAGASDDEATSVFLPSDAGPTSTTNFRWRDGAVFDLDLLPCELRVDRDARGLVYRFSPKMAEVVESRNLGEFNERAFKKGGRVTLDVRPPVTFGEVLPLLAMAEERGTLLTFVGAARSPLHKAKD